jgi:transcription initiation factor IIE alpha subunit
VTHIHNPGRWEHDTKQQLFRQRCTRCGHQLDTITTKQVRNATAQEYQLLRAYINRNPT